MRCKSDRVILPPHDTPRVMLISAAKFREIFKEKARKCTIHFKSLSKKNCNITIKNHFKEKVLNLTYNYRNLYGLKMLFRISFTVIFYRNVKFEFGPF